MSIIKDIFVKKSEKYNGAGDRDVQRRFYTEDGGEVYEEDVIAFIEEELNRRCEQRRSCELQWRLNANFLLGHQNCDINPYRADVEDRETQYEYMQRACYNRISPIIDTRLANLETMHFDMTVNPATNEVDDYEKACISTKILSYLQNATDFDSIRRTLLSWSEMCGTSFIMSWWDRDAGEMIGSVDVGEDGEEKNRPLYEGDIRYGVLTPYEVYPDSINIQSIKDQRSIIIEQVMKSEDVEELYGVKVAGGNVETYSLCHSDGAGGFGYPNTDLAFSPCTVEDSVKLITYFERKSKKHPSGRLIICAGDKVLFYGTLPYDDIPIVALKCKDIPGQFFGRSIIEELIPLQRAYNGCKNKIHDYIRTLASNPLLVPEGSIDDIDSLVECGTAPGAIIEYDADRGKPSPLVFQSISGEVRAECDDIVREMEYVAGVSQLMVTGSRPSGVTSGTAIERLMKIDNTRLSLTADSIREAIKQVAITWLKIYKRHAKTCRIISITGQNEMSSVLTWTGDDINSYDVTFDSDNELKNSEERQRENFMTAMSMGLFSDEDGKLPHEFRQRAIEMLRLGNYGALMSENELQITNARRENSMLSDGCLPECDMYDDDRIHIEEHKRFALQMRFKVMRKKSPELAHAFDEHIRAHSRRLAFEKSN